MVNVWLTIWTDSHKEGLMIYIVRKAIKAIKGQDTNHWQGYVTGADLSCCVTSYSAYV